MSGGLDELHLFPRWPAPGHGLSATQCCSISGPARLPLPHTTPGTAYPRGAGQRGDRTALDFRAVQAGKQVPLLFPREEKLRLAVLFGRPPTLASPVYPTFLFSQNESRSIVSDSLRPHGRYSSWNSPGQNTGVGRLSCLQGMFPTQGSNPGFLHCRQILNQLSHREAC